MHWHAIAQKLRAAPPSSAADVRDATGGRPAGAGAEAGRALQVAEVDAIRAAMRVERGNLTRAARRLGIAKSTLYAKIDEYGLAADVAMARRGLP